MCIRKLFALAVILVMTSQPACFVPSGSSDGNSSAIYALVAGSGWTGPNSLTVIELKPDRDDRFSIEHTLDLNDGMRDPIVSTKDQSGNKRAFIVNRQYGSLKDMGSVSRLDKDILFQVEQTFSVNDGTYANPYDILALKNGKAYISRWDAAYSDILIVDPDTGADLKTIDLSGTGTNADGFPRPAWMYADGKTVYVMLQNIDGFWSYSPGRVAVVDTRDDTVDGFIDLTATNPGDAAIINGKMIIACTGNWWDNTTSGIEIVDLDTQTSQGITLRGDVLGGFVTQMAVLNAHRAFVVVNDGGWPSTDNVFEIDPTDGQIIDTWYTQPFLYASDIALAADKYLLIADNSGSAVVLMSLEGGNVVETIVTDLPPVSMAIWNGGRL